ncbi:MAG: DUF72 domain-containing protein [Roseibacillus sp.]
MIDLSSLKVSLDQLVHQDIFVGTSSWKYPGWIGQLYQSSRYKHRGKFSKSRFQDSCLEEYSEIFSTVCVDASYYRFPSEKHLETLAEKVPSNFRFSHKVTDTITIKNFPALKRHGKFAGLANPCYLNPDIFLKSFLSPLAPHREQTGLIIFEFSHFYPKDYRYGREFVSDLDSFLATLPTNEWDFGVEIRNASLLQKPYFDTLERHSVAHVYNQWQRMPDLADQLKLHWPNPENSPTGCRLLLKRGRNYNRAVESFAPYDQTKEVQENVRHASASLIRDRKAKASGRRTYIYANNRLEGNALATIEAILALVDNQALSPLPPEASP